MESPHRLLQDANFQGTLVVSTNMTEEERIEKWFYGPIEEQGETEGSQSCSLFCRYMNAIFVILITTMRAIFYEVVMS